MLVTRVAIVGAFSQVAAMLLLPAKVAEESIFPTTPLPHPSEPIKVSAPVVSTIRKLFTPY